jgi:hypothetical protein
MHTISRIESKFNVRWFKSVSDVLELTLFCSTNQLHIRTRYGSRRSPKAVQLQDEISSQVEFLDEETRTRTWCYLPEYSFILKREDWIAYKGHLKVIDVTNLVKPTEDGLMRSLGIDDCKGVTHVCNKSFLEEPLKSSLPIPPYYFAYKLDLFEKK